MTRSSRNFPETSSASQSSESIIKSNELAPQNASRFELAQKRRENQFPSIRQLYTTKKENHSFVRVAAPMVRYSRLPFRLLVREYGCDLTYTPMLISDSFTQSDSARDADFRTNPNDGPLIVQFASNKHETFGEVARALWGHCEGIGLNCGCPQHWVNKLNYGDILMKQPELLADILGSLGFKYFVDFLTMLLTLEFKNKLKLI